MVKMLLMQALLAMTALTVGACCCGIPTDSADGSFSVEAVDGHLVLRNRTDQTVHYVAIEEETAARVDLHFDPTQWPSVPAGGEVRIQYIAVMGYIRGSERAVVHWWRAQGVYGTVLRVAFR